MIFLRFFFTTKLNIKDHKKIKRQIKDDTDREIYELEKELKEEQHSNVTKLTTRKTT